MKTTLTLSGELHAKLKALSLNPLETAGVLLTREVRDELGDIRLLGVEFINVPESAYLRREVDSLGISSDGYVQALSRAEQIGAIAIWFHTHPGIDSIPLPSTHDVEVDGQIADLFRIRTGAEYYGAMIVSPTSSGISFSGFLESEHESRRPIDRIFVADDTFQLIPAFNFEGEIDFHLFDRNVRALGGNVQLALGQLRFGVVGCGGTGSAVVEQLVRLGARDFVLVDPDRLSKSNTTRVYGSQNKDINRPKVEIARDNILRIAPDAECRSIEGSVVEQRIARELGTCDILFGCTDDNAGRLVLSRLSSYLLIPVFDMGVLLSSDNSDQLTGIDGRVTTLVPGQACLICRGRIDTARAAAEMMPEHEHQRLVGEGYAPALGRVEPAVIPFTTVVAATAIAEIIERFTGYGPTPRPSELLLRYHEREISTNIGIPRKGHYCDPQAGKIGIGITNPFLGMTWSR